MTSRLGTALALLTLCVATVPADAGVTAVFGGLKSSAIAAPSRPTRATDRDEATASPRADARDARSTASHPPVDDVSLALTSSSDVAATLL